MELEAYKTLSKDELVNRIKIAKREKNAVILAHNYQILEVQDVADYCGDSLELSRLAAKTDSDVVVFCGVDFMAESAKILAPQKTVLLPEIKATCPMAQMVTPDALSRAKAENPDAVVLAYVNTTAAVKALTDICCTSANASDVVNSLGDREILFVPDKNLAHYTRKVTGASIKPWDGFCFVHNMFTVADVKRFRSAHPDAVFIVQLRKRYPDVGIWPLNEFAICGTMKLTTLDKVCWAIETGNHEIKLSGDIIEKARASLERMLEL